MQPASEFGDANEIVATGAGADDAGRIRRKQVVKGEVLAEIKRKATVPMTRWKSRRAAGSVSERPRTCKAS